MSENNYQPSREQMQQKNIMSSMGGKVPGSGGLGGRGRFAEVQKPKSIGRSLIRLIGYMKSSIPAIIAVCIVVMAGTALQVICPKILGNATTIIFSGISSGAGIDFSSLMRTLLIVAGLYIGTSIALFIQQRILVVISQKLGYVMRNKLKRKMNTLPILYFDRHSNGNLMSIAINDTDNIISVLQQGLTQVISSVILVVGILAVMISIDWHLALITCAIAPVSLFLIRAITPAAQKNNRAYMRLQGELNGHIEEMYNGHTVIRSFNGEDKAQEKFEGINGGMYGSGWRARFYGGLMMPGMTIIRNIDYILIAVVGAFKVASGSVYIGDMQAFLQYSRQFSQPFVQFSQIWNSILSSIASAERIFEVLDADDMVEYEEDFPNHKDEAKIVFDEVVFGYGDEPLMNGFSMKVLNGQMVAIVGHTGAGKSTLINLLERFYEIQGGSIRVDGKDTRNTDHHDLHAQIGMVLQDTWLFSGTIYDNIAYGNETATPEQIHAAARAAYVDEFVRKLPAGYDTVLNEDASNISQGQQQLITIARAFVSDPEILVLDEATSNVDSRTEMLIQKAMRRLLKNRTSFVIAHRLSTIYDADNIIVMQNGAIAETGTHSQLLGKGGVYAEIYNSQFTSLTGV